MGKGLLFPTSFYFQSFQVQNLGCYVVHGLVVSALLPAVAHGGSYFLSVSQVITNNVSLSRSGGTLPFGLADSLKRPTTQSSSSQRTFYLCVWILWEERKGLYVGPIPVWGVHFFSAFRFPHQPGGSFKSNIPLGKLQSAEPDCAPTASCASRGASAHRQIGMNPESAQRRAVSRFACLLTV